MQPSIKIRLPPGCAVVVKPVANGMDTNESVARLRTQTFAIKANERPSLTVEHKKGYTLSYNEAITVWHQGKLITVSESYSTVNGNL